MTALVHVALAADAAYVRHAAAAALSVAETTPGAVVHLLAAPDVGEEDRRRFSSTVAGAGGESVVHVIVDPRLDALATMDRIGTVMWYRLLLPSLLSADRVLYLDADTFVVADCAPLVRHELDGARVGAVHNVLEPGQRARVDALGLGADLPYFNSGVLVLDLDGLRAGGEMDRVVEVAAERADDLQWPDQDALNLVLGGSRQPLHPRFNAQNSLFHWGDWAGELFGADMVAEAVADPVVVHFEGPGPAKPWHVDARHPWRDAYRDLAARTPWGPLRLDTTPVPRRPTRRQRLRRWLGR